MYFDKIVVKREERHKKKKKTALAAEFKHPELAKWHMIKRPGIINYLSNTTNDAF